MTNAIREGALADAIGSIYAAVTEPGLLPAALRQVTVALDSDMAQLMTYDPVSERVFSSTASHEAPAQANVDYLTHYGAVDPRRPLLSKLPSGSLIAREEYFDDRFANRSEFYQDFLFRYDIRWTQGGRFDNADGTSSCLAVLRQVGRPAFDPADMQSGRMVLAHLEKAERLASRVAGLAHCELEVSSLVQWMPFPCAIVDSAGRVFAHNAALGKDVVGRHARFVYGRLLFHSADAQEAWIRHLSCVGRSGVPAWSLDGRQCPGCHLVPLRLLVPPAQSRAAGDLLLAIFNSSQGISKDAVYDFAAGFDLTPAEKAVLKCVLDGLSAKQIASARRTSIGTARSQIAVVLEKTMCRSQRELVIRARDAERAAQGCSTPASGGRR